MAVIKSVEEKYMKEALKQAKKAYALGEVPIGCVIVHEGKIIGRGYNRRNTDKNTLAHAEITAINKASKVIGDWRLEECTLYVTLEPCQMCAGAIVQARIPEVVMGCMNPKAGCAGSILNILEMPQFNHQVKVTRGAAGKRVWRPKRIGNTQGAAETRGWDTKNKYSTQTKKKNMKK